MVHDIKPPFLDGRLVLSKQSQPVVPVRDPTSDMAIIAKKGSQLMREMREKREREKAVKDQFKQAGTVRVRARARVRATARARVEGGQGPVQAGGVRVRE